jgi:hypothetical protein
MASLNEPTYTVFYHGGFSGRGQAADLLLEDAGASWKRGTKAELMEMDQSCFALPAVRNNATGVICGQTTAMTAFIGDELGYKVPAGQEFQALKIACDIADIWSEGYTNRGSGDYAKCAQFLEEGGRFQRFITCIDNSRKNIAKQMNADVNDWTYLLGTNPTYVDFLLLNAKLSMDFAFGEDNVAKVLTNANTPGLSSTITNMMGRPNIAAYFAKDPEPVLYARVKGMPEAPATN